LHYSFATSLSGLATSYAAAGTASTASLSFAMAGNQIVFARILDKDNGWTDYSQAITIQTVKQTPMITWANPAAITYGTALGATQLDATANVPGTFVYTPAVGTVLQAGANQTLSVTFTPTDTTHYTTASKSVTITVNKATLTVTANDASRAYGVANPAFTASYSGFVNGDTATVLQGSPSLTTTATPSSVPGSYAITAAPGTLTAADYTFIFVNGTLSVTPAKLSATSVSFSPTAGAPFSGTVATFTTADTLDGATSFIATITWGDGSTSAGTITGRAGSFSVSGSHTYADAGSETVTVQVSHTLGYTAAATATGTAVVTGLGQNVQSGQTASATFWEGPKGQALLDSFNGGSTATALSTWLATSFPDLYGANAGANNLTGKTNAQVAAYYVGLIPSSSAPIPLEAQVLAAALNVYATTAALGGAAGTAYGFTVSATGLGACSFNVGQDGAAFGVADNTSLNVYELLQAVDRQAVNGVLYNGDQSLRSQALDLFSSLNQPGSIG
jgi:hypothetical protein